MSRQGGSAGPSPPLSPAPPGDGGSGGPRAPPHPPPPSFASLSLRPLLHGPPPRPRMRVRSSKSPRRAPPSLTTLPPPCPAPAPPASPATGTHGAVERPHGHKDIGDSDSHSRAGRYSGFGRQSKEEGAVYSYPTLHLANLRLCPGGNAPVDDLEVDMDGGNHDDGGDCAMRPPSPAVSPWKCMPPSPLLSRPTSDDAPFAPQAVPGVAMPYQAPQHKDAPSSGYGLQGRHKFSSAPEPMLAETTGTVGAGALPSASPYAVGGAPTVLSAAVTPVPAPRTIKTLLEDTVSSGNQCNARPASGPFGPAPTPPSPPPARGRRRQEKQTYSAYLPRRLSPPFLEAADPVDLAQGPNPPVADLEVDMEESAFETAAAAAAVGHALGACGPGPVSSATAITAAAAAAALAEHQAGGVKTKTGRYIPLTERIQLARLQLAHEAMLARPGPSPAPAQPADGDATDVDMTDPAAVGSLLDLASLTPDKAWLENMPSLRLAGQPNGVRKYIGPLRYQLSAEVAARCKNLVPSKPRMRRSQQQQQQQQQRQQQTGAVREAGSSGGSGLLSSAKADAVQGAPVLEKAGKRQAERLHDKKRHRRHRDKRIKTDELRESAHTPAPPAPPAGALPQPEGHADEQMHHGLQAEGG